MSSQAHAAADLSRALKGIQKYAAQALEIAAGDEDLEGLVVKACGKPISVARRRQAARRLHQEILDYIEEHPGAVGNDIVDNVTGGTEAIKDALNELAALRLAWWESDGRSRARRWHVASGPGPFSRGPSQGRPTLDPR